MSFAVKHPQIAFAGFSRSINASAGSGYGEEVAELIAFLVSDRACPGFGRKRTATDFADLSVWQSGCNSRESGLAL